MLQSSTSPSESETLAWVHGSRFDLRTGAPSHLPATVPVAVHTVQVTESGDVLVALAD